MHNVLKMHNLLNHNNRKKFKMVFQFEITLKFSAGSSPQPMVYTKPHAKHNLDTQESEINGSISQILPSALLAINCQKQAIMITRQNREYQLFYLFSYFLLFGV